MKIINIKIKMYENYTLQISQHKHHEQEKKKKKHKHPSPLSPFNNNKFSKKASNLSKRVRLPCVCVCFSKKKKKKKRVIVPHYLTECCVQYNLPHNFLTVTMTFEYSCSIFLCQNPFPTSLCVFVSKLKKIINKKIDRG